MIDSTVSHEIEVGIASLTYELLRLHRLWQVANPDRLYSPAMAEFVSLVGVCPLPPAATIETLPAVEFAAAPADIAAASATAVATTAEDGDDDDIDRVPRQKVARHLMDGAVPVQKLSKETGFAVHDLARIINHEWFTQSSQGVHLTPAGRQEVG